MSLEETSGLFILICPLAVAGCPVMGQDQTGWLPTRGNLQLLVSDFSSFWPCLRSISQSQSSVLQLIGVQAELWLAWLSLPRKALAKQKQSVAGGKGERALSIHILILKGYSYYLNRVKGTGQADSTWGDPGVHTTLLAEKGLFVSLHYACLFWVRCKTNARKQIICPWWHSSVSWHWFVVLRKALNVLDHSVYLMPWQNKDICAAGLKLPSPLYPV